MAGPGGMLPLSIELTAAGATDVAGSMEQIAVSLNSVKAAAETTAPALEKVAAAATSMLHAVDLTAVDLKDTAVRLDGVSMSAERAQAMMAAAGAQGASSFRGNLNQLLPALEETGKSAEKAGLSFFQVRTALVGISALSGVNPMVGQMGAAFMSLSGTLGLVSASTLGVGAAIAAVGAELVAAGSAATKFDQEMMSVRNNTTMSDNDFKGMVSTVKELASATGSATQDLAEGYRRAFNETGNAVAATKELDAANMLAVGTYSKVADTTNALTTYMHNFGMAEGEATNAANALFVSAAQGNMTMQQFAEYSTRASAVMGAYKGSAADLGGALAVLTRAFGNASVAQTQFDGMLQHIVAPTAGAEKELKRLSDTTGIDLVKDFSQAGLQTRGLNGILDDLRIALNGDNQELQKLIPGIRGGQGAMVLLKASTGELGTAIAGVGDALDGKTTPALDAFGRAIELPAQKADMLHQRLGLLQVAIGEPLSQAFGHLIEGAMKLGDGFDFVGSRLEPFRGIIVGSIPIVGQFFTLFDHGAQLLNLAKAAAGELGEGFHTLSGKAQEAWQEIANSQAGQTAESLIKGVGQKITEFKDGPVAAAEKKATDAWGEIANSAAAHLAEGLAAEVGSAFSALGGVLDVVRSKAIATFAALHLAASGGGSSDPGYGSGGYGNSFGQSAGVAAENQAALNTELQSGSDYLTRLGAAQGAATERQAKAIQVDAAEAEAKRAVSAETAKYAGQSLKQLQSEMDTTNAGIASNTAQLDYLRSKLADAKENNNTVDVETYTAAIKDESSKTQLLRADQQALTTALDLAKAAHVGAAGGSKQDSQAALDAAEAAQKAQSNYATLRNTEKTQLDQQRALSDQTKDALLPIQEQQAAVVLKDTEAHKTLVNELAQVRSGFSGNADQVKSFNGAIDENLSRLNDQNDETGALRQELISAKTAFDGMSGSEREFSIAAQEATNAVKAEQLAVSEAQRTVRDDQEAITAANKVLTQYKETLSDLTSALNAAKTAEQDFAHAALPGAQAFDDQKAALTQSMNEIQLKIDQIIGTDLAKGMTTQAAEADAALIPLNAQLDILKNRQDTLSVQSSIALDPMTQQIKDLEAAGNKFDFGNLIDQLTKAQAGGQTGLGDLIKQLTALNGANTSTLTFQQITQGITAAQEAQQKLTGALPAANSAVSAQQAAVNGLTTSLEADQKALQVQQDKLAGLQTAAQKATEKLQTFKDTMATATTAIAASSQVLENDLGPLRDTQAALKNVSDAEKIASDTTHDNFNPQLDAMSKKVAEAEAALHVIQDNIRQNHINAMQTGAKATDTLTTSHFNLSDQIVTHTTPDIQTLGEKAGAQGASKDIDTLSTASGTAGLTGAMDTLYPQVDIATASMQAFDRAILSAQQDAAKGIDLDIRIHSSGGSIPGHATGTSYSQGGLARVGEFGPELVRLPSGSQVIPGTGAGGGFSSNVPPIVITGNTFMGTSTDMLQQLARMLQTEIERQVTFNG